MGRKLDLTGRALLTVYYLWTLAWAVLTVVMWAEFGMKTSVIVEETAKTASKLAMPFLLQMAFKTVTGRKLKLLHSLIISFGLSYFY